MEDITSSVNNVDAATTSENILLESVSQTAGTDTVSAMSESQALKVLMDDDKLDAAIVSLLNTAQKGTDGLAVVLAPLSSIQRVDLTRAVGPERLPAAVFPLLRPSELALLLNDWTAEDGGRILQQLSAAERGEVLVKLPHGTLEHLTPVLSQEDLHLAEYFQAFPEQSVGRVMSPLSAVHLVQADMDPAAALEAYIKIAQSPRNLPATIFVIDPLRHFLGVLHIASMAFLAQQPPARTGDASDEASTAPKAILADHCTQPLVTLTTKMTQQEMHSAIRNVRGGMDAFPVLDEDGMLVGVVTMREYVTVTEQEALKSYQVASLDPVGTSFSKSPRIRLFLRRSGWLLALLLMNIVSAYVVGSFEETLEANIQLAFFIPLLIDMGGNSGSQCAALIISSLSARDLQVRDWRRAFYKEIWITLMLGGVFGLVAFLVAFIQVRVVDISLVVGASAGIIISFSDLLGLFLPFLATAIKFDPALMSSPLITTVADVGGLAIYLGIAMTIL